MFRYSASRVKSAALPLFMGATALGSIKVAALSDSASKSVRTVPLSMQNRVVLITGASAGIGASCAWRFAEEGSKLVLIGRREDRLLKLKKEINQCYPEVRIHTVAMSVADTEKVAALPESLPEEFKAVDVLVNNAGLALGVATVDENSVTDAKTVLDTNVLGVIAFCSAFLPGMKKRNFGHIINIGSVAGHYAYANGSVYNASKYGVLGFTEAARHDLASTPIRITHISPGLVGNTEFSNVRFNDDADKAKKVYADLIALHPDDVADNVVYAATRPAHVQIAEIMMYCTNQSGPRDIARVGPSLGAKFR